jgi:hypothetical protein
MKLAPTALMWNKAKTLLVPIGDPEGRFFYCGEGYPIPDNAPLKVVQAEQKATVQRSRPVPIHDDEEK